MQVCSNSVVLYKCSYKVQTEIQILYVTVCRERQRELRELRELSESTREDRGPATSVQFSENAWNGVGLGLGEFGVPESETSDNLDPRRWAHCATYHT
jgi:hypothetical protein